MRKVIISDGENENNSSFCKKCGKEIPEGEEYCEDCEAELDFEEASKPLFPRLNRSFMRNLPPDDDEEDDYYDDDEYDDEDDEEEDDDYTQSVYQNHPLIIACIAAGAVIIAVAFLIIGIYIGRNSKSPFIDHFDLGKEKIYIDVIED